MATADLHAGVDAGFSGSFERDTSGYIAFLTSLAHVVVPLERALETAGVSLLLPDWSERRRTRALVEDLRDLDREPPTEAIVPPMGGEAWQFGALYVLEGSRLGGAVLVRRALDNADIRVRAATRYLGHGSGRSFWPSFLARLEASSAVRQAPQEAVAGAREIFTLFSSCIARVN
jgi:heme oxygenase